MGTETTTSDNPPFVNIARILEAQGILRSWVPAPYERVAITRRRYVTETGTIDAPPPGIRQSHIVLSWDGLRRPPSVSGAPVIDTPPLVNLARILEAQGVIRSWEPPPFSPFLGGRQPLAKPGLPVSQIAIQVDQPPSRASIGLPPDMWDADFEVPLIFNSAPSNVNEPPRHQARWLERVVGTWAEAAPHPQRSRQLNAGTLAVPVDSIVFSGLRRVSTRWPEPSVDMTAIRRTLRVPTSLDQPSGDNRVLRTGHILRAWDPAPSDIIPTHRMPVSLLGIQVDDPVGLSAGVEALTEVLTRWLPEPPLPVLRRLLMADVLAQRVDEPPHDFERLAILLATLETWQPPESMSVFRALSEILSEPSVYDPRVAGFFAQLSQIARSWDPRDPDPITRAPLAPDVLNVKVDDPPFNSRTELPGILDTWKVPDLHPGPGRFLVQLGRIFNFVLDPNRAFHAFPRPRFRAKAPRK